MVKTKLSTSGESCPSFWVGHSALGSIGLLLRLHSLGLDWLLEACSWVLVGVVVLDVLVDVVVVGVVAVIYQVVG